MTFRQVALVQESFRLIQPILEDAVALFYDRTFELDPSMRQMFKSTREDQSRKVAQILSIVIHGLARPEELRGAVETLGRRHGSYGARPEHYATMGEALLWTLEKGLGKAFTADVKEAWTSAYTWLASTMLDAQASAQLEPALVG